MLIITFNSTTYAYLMEKLRREDELPGRLMPLPKNISAGCGACFSSEKNDVEFWKNYMKDKGVEYDKIYEDISLI